MHAALHLADRTLEELGRRYIWWEPVGEPPGPDRIAAQVMNLGTYADILRLEEVVGRDRLAAIMRQAEPGWFSPPSWEFWRGRLGLADLPDGPPRRRFGG